MPIYSANRSGSMTLNKVVANESYTSNNFGRILYETQLNDMAIFEAILTCDFNEVKGIHEGTILEAEVKEINKKSFKEFGKNIIEGLRKFFAKVKGLLRDARANIAAWIASESKKAITHFNDAVKGKLDKWNGSFSITIYDHKNAVYKINKDAISSLINSNYNKHHGDRSSSDICMMMLNYNLTRTLNGSVTNGEFKKQALAKCSYEMSVNKNNVEYIKSELSKGSDYIKSLKEHEKNVGEAITETINAIENTIKDDVDKDNNIAALNRIVAGFESYVTLVTKAAIDTVRKDMSAKRAALTKVIAEVTKANVHIKEASILESIDEINSFIDGNYDKNAFSEAVIADMNALLA